MLVSATASYGRSLLKSIQSLRSSAWLQNAMGQRVQAKDLVRFKKRKSAQNLKKKKYKTYLPALSTAIIRDLNKPFQSLKAHSVTI